MTPIRSVLFLAYPDVSEQDLFAPWELLRNVAFSLARSGQQLEVKLGSLEGGVVRTQMGARIETEHVAPGDRFDLVYVPGGVGAGVLSSNPVALQLLRNHHAEGRWVAANCAGMAVLHRSGVLDGVEVTVPATLARRLPAQGTRVVSPRRAWQIVPQRRIFSAGGAATAHPSTIALVWHLFGEAQARELAANWDTHPLHGEALFALAGPVMNDDPATAAKVQDAWEDVFLPQACGAAKACRVTGRSGEARQG
jgi:putative intracellular protease/amidase